MGHYLITGVAGFIASRVADMLLVAGHNVTGVDNLNHAYDVGLKEYRLKRLSASPLFSFHHLDISQKTVVETLDRRAPYDAAINLAARAGVRASVENPLVFFETNTIGTLNILELCRRCQVPKFILASTSSIYGKNAPLPTPETADSDHPLQPYAASKKGAEALCYSYHYLYDIDVTIFRYFTVYGPAGRPDMVMFRFAQWISEGKPVKVNGDGEQSRGFTFVDDIAEGTILGLKPLKYEVINLGGHQSITINKLLELMEKKIGKKALVEYLPPHPADMQANLADIRKAALILGWRPKVNFEEGVRRLVDWYLQEQEWASQIDTR
jgi:nucleoside-diphosphate-sugar epimerase